MKKINNNIINQKKQYLIQYFSLINIQKYSIYHEIPLIQNIILIINKLYSSKTIINLY